MTSVLKQICVYHGTNKKNCNHLIFCTCVCLLINIHISLNLFDIQLNKSSKIFSKTLKKKIPLGMSPIFDANSVRMIVLFLLYLF